MPTTKLPSTGTRLVDAAMKRDAMIALYEMQSLKENPDKDGHVYGPSITDCEKYAIGRANFCRARGGLKAWRLAHPDSNDHAYFLGLKKPGAPTKLLADEEHFLAERLNLQAAHGFGMDERHTASAWTSGRPSATPAG